MQPDDQNSKSHNTIHCKKISLRHVPQSRPGIKEALAESAVRVTFTLLCIQVIVQCSSILIGQTEEVYHHSRCEQSGFEDYETHGQGRSSSSLSVRTSMSTNTVKGATSQNTSCPLKKCLMAAILHSGRSGNTGTECCQMFFSSLISSSFLPCYIHAYNFSLAVILSVQSEL